MSDSFPKQPDQPEKGISEGGMHFHSTVYAPNSQFAAHDIINYGAGKTLTAEELHQSLSPLYEAIQNSSRPKEIQEQAEKKTEELERELQKGEKADKNAIDQIVGGLVGLIPSAVSAIGTVFIGPVLAGLAGPVTKAIIGAF